MAETQIYGYGEMLRYLQHNMSQQEMHAFEKALMNDPFLADAFEGLSASNTALAEKHIEAIERSLQNNQQKAKVVPLVTRETPWWKIAAVVLLIASAGAITYLVLHFNANKQQQLATKTADTFSKEKDSLRPAEKSVAKTVVPFITLNKKNTSPIIHENVKKAYAYQSKDKPAVADTISRKEPLMVQSIKVPLNENSELAAAPLVAQTEEKVVIGYGKQKKSENNVARSTVSADAQNVFKGRIVDKSGEPLAFADVKANNRAVATTADAHGNFSLKAPDTVLEVKVTSAGFAAARAKIASNKADNKIALKEDELSLSEVIVSNLSKKKKSIPVSVHVDTTIAAEPVGGWKSYKQYLNHQLDSLQLEDGNTDEDVVLEFWVDKQGKPTDVKAPGDIDKMIAEKAKQIITNGPRWKNRKKDNKVKVVIVF